MRLPAQFRGTSTRAALIVATGVLASSISIPLSWHKARVEGAASGCALDGDGVPTAD
jgi:hypothetical protein